MACVCLGPCFQSKSHTAASQYLSSLCFSLAKYSYVLSSQLWPFSLALSQKLWQIPFVSHSQKHCCNLYSGLVPLSGQIVCLKKRREFFRIRLAVPFLRTSFLRGGGLTAGQTIVSADAIWTQRMDGKRKCNPQVQCVIHKIHKNWAHWLTNFHSRSFSPTFYTTYIPPLPSKAPRATFAQWRGIRLAIALGMFLPKTNAPSSGSVIGWLDIGPSPMNSYSWFCWPNCARIRHMKN